MMHPVLVFEFEERASRIKCNSKPTDSSVFLWSNKSKLNGLLCMHIDDFLLGGTQLFLSNISLSHLNI